jgi:hypothetical protein
LGNYAAVAVLFATAIVMVVRAAMARLAKANLHMVALNAQRLGQGRGSPITMQSPSQRKFHFFSHHVAAIPRLMLEAGTPANRYQIVRLN